MFQFLNLELLFLVISIFFSFLAYGIYYKSIFLKKSNPHLYSWLIWWIISITVWIIQFNENGWLWSINTFLVWFLCLWIAFLAFKKWDKNITLSDKIYLFLWILSIIIWIFTTNAIYSIIILILVDIFGFIPTFRKLFQNPYDENILPYFLSFLWYSFSILSLSNFTFITGWYVFLTAIFNLTLCFMVIYKRNIIEKLNNSISSNFQTRPILVESKKSKKL